MITDLEKYSGQSLDLNLDGFLDKKEFPEGIFNIALSHICLFLFIIYLPNFFKKINLTFANISIFSINRDRLITLN